MQHTLEKIKRFTWSSGSAALQPPTEEKTKDQGYSLAQSHTQFQGMLLTSMEISHHVCTKPKKHFKIPETIYTTVQ